MERTQRLEGDCPPRISELVEKISRDIKVRHVLCGAEMALREAGVTETRQLLELHPSDFDALKMPLLLKNRLRRIRERGGWIPEDMLGRGDAAAPGWA